MLEKLIRNYRSCIRKQCNREVLIGGMIKLQAMIQQFGMIKFNVDGKGLFSDMTLIHIRVGNDFDNVVK